MNKKDFTVFEMLTYLKEKSEVSEEDFLNKFLPHFENRQDYNSILFWCTDKERIIKLKPHPNRIIILGEKGIDKIEYYKRLIAFEKQFEIDEKENLKNISIEINSHLNKKFDVSFKIIQHKILSALFHRDQFTQNRKPNELGEMFTVNHLLTAKEISLIINESEETITLNLWILIERDFVGADAGNVMGFYLKTMGAQINGSEAFLSMLLLREYKELNSEAEINEGTHTANQSVIDTNKIQRKSIIVTGVVAVLTLIALIVQLYIAAKELKMKEDSKPVLVPYVQPKN